LKEKEEDMVQLGGKKFLVTLGAFLFILFFTISAANALVLTPESGESGVTRWDSPPLPTSNIDANDVKFYTGYEGDLFELYKNDYPDVESGPLASIISVDWYEGPYGGLIEFEVAPDRIPLYLVVKDGIHYHFIFDLFALGWENGEEIDLRDFGPPGAISHVALYGNGFQVPEPSTLALLGIGFLGLGLIGLRRKIR
jgi:hypothetical protein